MKCIPNSLFAGCLKLKYLDIPSSIKEIKFGAFERCKSLEGIHNKEKVKKEEFH